MIPPAEMQEGFFFGLISHLAIHGLSIFEKLKSYAFQTSNFSLHCFLSV